MGAEAGAPFDPLVSVCLPVFNGERFLAEAVRSVLEQTYRDFELLVFDDGSSDSSWAILEAFHDPRMSLHRNSENLGAERNWNQGLAAARGKYIKIFHQDDLLARDCLERQVAALEEDPSSVLAFCRRTIIRPNGKALLSRGAPWADGAIGQGQVIRRCALSGANVVGEPSAVLFRAESARQAGFFDGSIPYLIDLDYWIRLLSYGPGVYLDHPLASFRISQRQWSATIGLRQGRDFVAFLKRMEQLPIAWGGPWVRGWGMARAHANGILRALIHRFGAR